LIKSYQISREKLSRQNKKAGSNENGSFYF
jgi:hypothetical protein